MLYSIVEAARMLGGLSPWTLRKNVSLGRVRVVRLGRRVFLDAEELERIRRQGLPSLQSGHYRNFGVVVDPGAKDQHRESCLEEQTQ